jgi:demethylmenaquinone methyltransferase/2-methoxy-6-polyprenyl-1,4-benzoquinol methylase
MSVKVNKMFASIASKYDLLNDVLSFGIHKKWRSDAVQLSNVDKNSNVLDCACGTGDFSFEFEKYTQNVTGIDFCQPMLDIAIEKAKSRGSKAKFLQADVLSLPFADNSFDVISIGFGIRNVDDVGKAIAEMGRTLKDGGRLIILEFGQPEGFFKGLYNFYSKKIMPTIGKLLAKSEEAYTYLPETAAAFPCKEDFLNIANGAYKFSKSNYKTLTFGIAYIYYLEK